ncbi:MAG: hypothetical protein CML66_25240 [Rhodobacteraceae bacterium]|nr:hypothetical protein [Paracoccaceae bacterium]MAY47112.1 hypothetical protein [Paracoccaceae bacterium]QEW19902.1 Antibiotic biosynthesis monooxygenase [Marinibacterium anthonyi]
MIVVTGKFKLTNPASALELQQATMKTLTESRKEPGCIVYEFSQVIGEGPTFRVYEEWEDEAALAAHSQMPYVIAFNDALAKAGVEEKSVMKFEGGPKTALG